MITRLFLSLFLACTMLASGQNTIPEGRVLKSNSIAINLVGAPSWPLGISNGQLLTDRLSFELGVGIFSGGAGLHYYNH